MKINIQQKLFSDKDKERISNELLNGIGAQPTPQPVVDRKKNKHEYYLSIKNTKKKEWDKKYYDQNRLTVIERNKKARLAKLNERRAKDNEYQHNKNISRVAELDLVYIKSLLRNQGLPQTASTINSKMLTVLVARGIKSNFKDLDTNRLRQLSNQIIKGEKQCQ